MFFLYPGGNNFEKGKIYNNPPGRKGTGTQKKEPRQTEVIKHPL